MNVNVLTGVSSDIFNTQNTAATQQSNSAESFDNILATAMNMVKETNNYQNNAEEEEIKFALGESTNTHELLVAQEKANIALSYTVAVRDKVIDAYKEIMNMQIQYRQDEQIMPDRLKAILEKIKEWWLKFTTKQKTLLISITCLLYTSPSPRD